MLRIGLMILTSFILLSACSTQPSKDIKEVDENEIDEIEQIDETQLVKEQIALNTYFEEMIKAADENDKETFLSFQDETNELFYKEQEVWLTSLNEKRIEGWDVSVDINTIKLDTLENGSLQIQININNEEMDSSNRITYPISKVNGTWKLNDLPFKVISDGPINLYYPPSRERDAQLVLADVKAIVELYSQTFDWNPKELNVKLYSSLEEISASVAWPSLYGVAVPFTSLKFVVQGSYSDVTYGLMKHEVVHMMLADLTNDNAPTFMQEGLAIFVSSSVIEDASGNLQLDFKNTEDREKVILENTKDIIAIEELKDANYTDDSLEIYNVGFLITNYLIQAEGIDNYLEMLKILKEYDILEKGNPEIDQIIYERAIDALEQTYGPIDKLSNEYIEYFNKRL